MKQTLTSLFLLTLLATAATAQMAPRDTAKATIGGHAVAVEYGQPALNGRDIGALIAQLPEDRMWRAGSEQVTTFTTDGAVRVGGKTVPAGKYSLYVHCGDNNAFSLVLNSKVGVPLGEIWAQAPPELKNEPWPHMNYTHDIGDSEVARVAMKKATSSGAHDRLKFAFQQEGGSSVLTMSWGEQSWSVPVGPAN